MRRLALAGATLTLIWVVGPALAFGDCGAEHYRSSDGSCVHSPTKKDENDGPITAYCRDGTHSMSHHRSGTCSRHGGVARWVRDVP